MNTRPIVLQLPAGLHEALLEVSGKATPHDVALRALTIGFNALTSTGDAPPLPAPPALPAPEPEPAPPPPFKPSAYQVRQIRAWASADHGPAAIARKVSLPIDVVRKVLDGRK